MSKSILVIDTPKNCAECKLMFLQGIGESICNAVDWEERPSWCPLRPLPLKGTMENVDECEYNRGFVDGRNHCIDLITGETE